MLAVRAQILVELIVAAAATALLASSPAAPTHAFVAPALPRAVIEPSPVAPADLDACWKLPAVADAAYRANHFAAAARAVPSACDSATLLHYLSLAWEIAMDRGANVVDRFEALEQARTLDLAFGGAHADELDAAMRLVAPRAADALDARGDADSARRARAIAQLLGH